MAEIKTLLPGSCRLLKLELKKKKMKQLRSQLRSCVCSYKMEEALRGNIKRTAGHVALGRAMSVSSPLWSRLLYLNDYGMDCLYIQDAKNNS